MVARALKGAVEGGGCRSDSASSCAAADRPRFLSASRARPARLIGGLFGLRTLAFTFEALVIGSVLYSTPFVVQPIRNAFEAIGERPLEVASTLRATPWDAFWTVAVPLARPGFMTGAVLGFAHNGGRVRRCAYDRRQHSRPHQSAFGRNLRLCRILAMGTGSHSRGRHAGIFFRGHSFDDASRKAHRAAGNMTSTDAVISVRYTGVLGRFKLDVAFEVPMRGIIALFGPSGCGKTTVLRCMAGLNRLPGRLVVDDEVWQDDATGKFLPPHERRIGYVFQEASLFAHLSVRGNLLYGYRRALKRGAAANTRLDEVVELLGIGPLIDRATGGLSGGERQRIALGRALLAQPLLFLMDEPLSALDRMTKEEILPYLEALCTSSSIPALYVSHDMSEIERLADHMVLLDSGRVAAAGPLDELMADSRLPIARSQQSKRWAWRLLCVFRLTTIVPRPFVGELRHK